MLFRPSAHVIWHNNYLQLLGMAWGAIPGSKQLTKAAQWGGLCCAGLQLIPRVSQLGVQRFPGYLLSLSGPHWVPSNVPKFSKSGRLLGRTLPGSTWCSKAVVLDGVFSVDLQLMTWGTQLSMQRFLCCLESLGWFILNTVIKV